MSHVSVTGRPTTAGRKRQQQQTQQTNTTSTTNTATTTTNNDAVSNNNNTPSKSNLEIKSNETPNKSTNFDSLKVESHSLTPIERLFEACKHADLESLHTVLHSVTNNNNYTNIVNSLDEQGWSPLMYAVDNGNEPIVIELLSNNANANHADKYGINCLMLAVNHSYYEITKLLIQHKANVNSISIDTGYSVLMKACQSNFQHNLMVVKLLIDNGANVNYSNKQGLNCFHCAVMYNNIEIVQYLLTLNKLDINAKLSDSRNCLVLAAEQGSYSMISELISLGADYKIKLNNSQLLTDIKPNHTILLQNPDTHKSIVINNDNNDKTNNNNVKQLIEKAINDGLKLKEIKDKEAKLAAKRAERAKIEKQKREEEEKNRLAAEAEAAKAYFKGKENGIGNTNEHKEPDTPLEYGYMHPSVAAKLKDELGPNYKPEKPEEKKNWHVQAMLNNNKPNISTTTVSTTGGPFKASDIKSPQSAELIDNNNSDNDNDQVGQPIEEDNDDEARAAFRKQMMDKWQKESEQAAKEER